MDTAHCTFGFLTTNQKKTPRRTSRPRRVSAALGLALSARPPKALGSPPGTQRRVHWVGRTLARPLRSSWGGGGGERTAPRRQRGLQLPKPAPRPPLPPAAPRAAPGPPRRSLPLRAKAVALSAPSRLHLPPPPPLKKIHPLVQSRHFAVIYLAPLGFSGNILPRSLEVRAALRGVRGARGWAAGSSSGAGLLPSVQLQHPAGEERGSEARMQGRREAEEAAVGGEGAGASRQSACAPRAGAAPRGARPEGPLPPRAPA